MFAYAAALLDFQKGGVGYFTKGNGLHFFSLNLPNLFAIYFFDVNEKADARQTPSESSFQKVSKGFSRFQKVLVGFRRF